jgi:4-carboxymuconolactone decarboxylase
MIGAADVGAMTPEQRRVHDLIAAGPRGSVPRPFFAMLDAPALAEAIQGVGVAIRFGGTLPAGLREVAILAAAAAWGSDYEWAYHEPIARDLGVGAGAIAAARTGVPSGEDAVADAVAAFVHAAIRERRSDADRLEAVVAALGRAGASEVVAIAGYYPLLALFHASAEPGGH